ncbi:hypothetical protein AMTR_s00154p00049230 [Amborella trichopoda]|uniref:Uncharacterized protein n=1 Tax=Amborella trichopoda TaxID=13333 RepID=W1PIS1_AMBTC|nr:hypothetical protein AMTR_s00154p00049230 [Amborella trichopoda]
MSTFLINGGQALYVAAKQDTQLIEKNLVKKCIEVLFEIVGNEFYEAFSKNLKYVFSLDGPNNFARRVHRMLKFGLSINEDEAANNIPPLEEDSYEESKMEEVDYEIGT